jgi:hypothetical protein
MAQAAAIAQVKRNIDVLAHMSPSQHEGRCAILQRDLTWQTSSGASQAWSRTNFS